MSGTFTFIIIMIITILLGRYALSEGQRVERQKKFMKDMEDFDSKKAKNEKK